MHIKLSFSEIHNLTKCLFRLKLQPSLNDAISMFLNKSGRMAVSKFLFNLTGRF